MVAVAPVSATAVVGTRRASVSPRGVNRFRAIARASPSSPLVSRTNRRASWIVPGASTEASRGTARGANSQDSSADRVVQVGFTMPGWRGEGEALLVGAGPLLGDWDPDVGFEVRGCQRDPAGTSEAWLGLVQLPSGASGEFKVVIRTDDKVDQWSPDDDAQIPVGENAKITSSTFEADFANVTPQAARGTTGLAMPTANGMSTGTATPTGTAAPTALATRQHAPSIAKLSFEDVLPRSTPSAVLATVVFRAVASLRVGQRLVVAGNCPTLGYWRPVDSAATMTWSPGNVWTVAVKFDAFAVFGAIDDNSAAAWLDFKLVIVDDNNGGSETWVDGDNFRVKRLPGSEATATMNEWLGGEHYECGLGAPTTDGASVVDSPGQTSPTVGQRDWLESVTVEIVGAGSFMGAGSVSVKPQIEAQPRNAQVPEMEKESESVPESVVPVPATVSTVESPEAVLKRLKADAPVPKAGSPPVPEPAAELPEETVVEHAERVILDAAATSESAKVDITKPDVTLVYVPDGPEDKSRLARALRAFDGGGAPRGVSTVADRVVGTTSFGGGTMIKKATKKKEKGKNKNKGGFLWWGAVTSEAAAAVAATSSESETTVGKIVNATEPIKTVGAKETFASVTYRFEDVPLDEIVAATTVDQSEVSVLAETFAEGSTETPSTAAVVSAMKAAKAKFEEVAARARTAAAKANAAAEKLAVMDQETEAFVETQVAVEALSSEALAAVQAAKAAKEEVTNTISAVAALAREEATLAAKAAADAAAVAREADKTQVDDVTVADLKAKTEKLRARADTKAKEAASKTAEAQNFASFEFPEFVVPEIKVDAAVGGAAVVGALGVAGLAAEADLASSVMQLGGEAVMTGAFAFLFANNMVFSKDREKLFDSLETRQTFEKFVLSGKWMGTDSFASEVAKDAFVVFDPLGIAAQTLAREKEAKGEVSVAAEKGEDAVEEKEPVVAEKTEDAVEEKAEIKAETEEAAADEKKEVVAEKTEEDAVVETEPIKAETTEDAVEDKAEIKAENEDDSEADDSQENPEEDSKKPSSWSYFFGGKPKGTSEGPQPPVGDGPLNDVVAKPKPKRSFPPISKTVSKLIPGDDAMEDAFASFGAPTRKRPPPGFQAPGKVVIDENKEKSPASPVLQVTSSPVMQVTSEKEKSPVMQVTSLTSSDSSKPKPLGLPTGKHGVSDFLTRRAGAAEKFAGDPAAKPATDPNSVQAIQHRKDAFPQYRRDMASANAVGEPYSTWVKKSREDLSALTWQELAERMKKPYDPNAVWEFPSDEAPKRGPR